MQRSHQDRLAAMALFQWARTMHQTQGKKDAAEQFDPTFQHLPRFAGCCHLANLMNDFSTISEDRCNHFFAARYAMHKRGVCRRAASVRLSVTFVHSVETSEHIFKYFHHPVATPF